MDKEQLVVISIFNLYDVYFSKLRNLLKSQNKFDLEYWLWQRDKSQNPLAVPAQVIFKGGGQFNNKLMFYYPIWMGKVFLKVLREDCQNKLFFCYGFDTALPIYIASFFKETKYIFANLDNFSKSYNWPLFIEKFISFLEKKIAKSAWKHILPSLSRWEKKDSNLFIVKNTPSLSTIKKIERRLKEQNTFTNDKLNIYLNGSLTQRRGVGILLRALKAIEEKNRIQVNIAGKPACKDAEELMSMVCTNYLGVLSQEDSLFEYFRNDLVFTFYDPAIKINQVAEPNKWNDCIFSNTPFIVNSEVKTAASFKSQNACFSIPYSDIESLSELILTLSYNRKAILEKKENIKRMDIIPWDIKMEKILEIY